MFQYSGDKCRLWVLHLVLEQKLVPTDEDLPQPFQNIGPVNHLLAGKSAADQKEDLRTE